MIRVIALTAAGRRLGERLCAHLATAELSYKPEPFAACVQQAFRAGEALVMICATGIVLRSLAPVITSKHLDPPVLALDEAGRFVIPLLSGHEGGANALAAQIAALLEAQAVITTANPYLNPSYAAGLGCERDCSSAELSELLQRCLQQAGLDPEQITSINSIDVKRDELGLQALATQLELPFQVFSAEQLMPLQAHLSTRSDYVYQTVGVYGVAESAALLAANLATGGEPELVLNKQKSKHATCAIARAYPPQTGESNA